MLPFILKFLPFHKNHVCHPYVQPKLATSGMLDRSQAHCLSTSTSTTSLETPGSCMVTPARCWAIAIVALLWVIKDERLPGCGPGIPNGSD